MDDEQLAIRTFHGPNLERDAVPVWSEVQDSVVHPGARGSVVGRRTMFDHVRRPLLADAVAGSGASEGERHIIDLIVSDTITRVNVRPRGREHG